MTGGQSLEEEIGRATEQCAADQHEQRILQDIGRHPVRRDETQVQEREGLRLDEGEIADRFDLELGLRRIQGDGAARYLGPEHWVRHARDFLGERLVGAGRDKGPGPSVLGPVLRHQKRRALRRFIRRVGAPVQRQG